ncbi:MAG: hypothetical protein ACOC8X_13555, partial [Chloroflexota bacterium]
MTSVCRRAPERRAGLEQDRRRRPDPGDHRRRHVQVVEQAAPSEHDGRLACLHHLRQGALMVPGPGDHPAPGIQQRHGVHPRPLPRTGQHPVRLVPGHRRRWPVLLQRRRVQ